MNYKTESCRWSRASSSIRSWTIFTSFACFYREIRIPYALGWDNYVKKIKRHDGRRTHVRKYDYSCTKFVTWKGGSNFGDWSSCNKSKLGRPCDFKSLTSNRLQWCKCMYVYVKQVSYYYFYRFISLLILKIHRIESFMLNCKPLENRRQKIRTIAIGRMNKYRRTKLSWV